MRRPEVGILALAILVSACAIPTDSPNWDMTWNVPVPDKGQLSVGVASFLPAGVTTVGTPPTAFAASVAAAPPISRALGAQCPTCPNGTAPKPAFTAPAVPTTVTLSSGTSLVSGTLTTGSQVVIAMNNGYTFDPLRPQAGSATTGTGTMTFTINNGSTTLGTRTLVGTSQAIPPGQTTNITIPLSGTIVTAQPITVTMTMDSPAGSTVAMNPNTHIFTATAQPTLNISSATVNIAAQTIAAAGDTIDLSGIDSTVVNRVKNDAQTQATMFLTITNPLTIGGSMTVSFSSPPGTPANETITPITKSVALTAATNATTPSVSTVSFNFTGIELRSILGHELITSFGGTTAAGSLTVTPTQKISMTSRMQLTFSIKEQ